MPQYPYSPINNNLWRHMPTLTADGTNGNTVDLVNPLCKGVIVVVDDTDHGRHISDNHGHNPR